MFSTLRHVFGLYTPFTLYHATTDTYRGRNVKNNNIKNEEGRVEYRPMKIIDVAGGTGDISFKILDKLLGLRLSPLQTFVILKLVFGLG